MWRRSFDVVIALVGLVLLAPVLLGIWCVVRLTSPGPGIFRQQRVGKDGVPFTILKFRTLLAGTERFGMRYVRWPTDELPLTPPGKVLRETHLDELPQLWNVLVGDMSLVGPRPLTCELYEHYLSLMPRYQMRTRVRPGLTGLAQVRGRSKFLRYGPKFMLSCDRAYLRKQSFVLDLLLLMRTARGILSGSA